MLWRSSSVVHLCCNAAQVIISSSISSSCLGCYCGIAFVRLKPTNAHCLLSPAILCPALQGVLAFIGRTAGILGAGKGVSRTFLSFYAVTVCELLGEAPQVCNIASAHGACLWSSMRVA